LKNVYPCISLARLCWLLGITRQAFYQHFWNQQDISTEQNLILDEVRRIRQEHPVMGTRKLQVLLQPFLLEHGIKMGRDALFNLLSEHKLLVRKRRRSVKTTQSHHWLKKYPNLIREWHPSAVLQLWVADITYVPMKSGFLYVSLITDAYSHKVVGYHIAETLETVHTIKALIMALENEKIAIGLIHHSDRGIQYCSYEYVKLLKQRDIKISMSENGDPLENPVAERINGILKNEYLKYYYMQNQSEAIEILHEVIRKYNTRRPHQSIRMLTPDIVHTKQLLVNKTWSKKHLKTCKLILGRDKVKKSSETPGQ
jgi:transposase InsO family protein